MVYGLTWLPALVLVFFFVPKYEPIFARLQSKGELPQLTVWLRAFVWFNQECYSLPALLLLIAFLAIDESVILLLRNRRSGLLLSWIWIAALVLAGLMSAVIVITAILLPIFQMSSAIS
jgi:hypothetical protein